VAVDDRVDEVDDWREWEDFRESRGAVGKVYVWDVSSTSPISRSDWRFEGHKDGGGCPFVLLVRLGGGLFDSLEASLVGSTSLNGETDILVDWLPLVAC
jgi:hypothetical protein